MEESVIRARIEKLITIVTNIDDTLIKLSLNPRASYTIDTGQSKETVTKANAAMLLTRAQRIQDEIDRLTEQLNGGGDPVYTRPAF